MTDKQQWTRREYLRAQILLHGAPLMMVNEAISSVAIEHPEWDLDGERKTFHEWLAEDPKIKRKA